MKNNLDLTTVMWLRKCTGKNNTYLFSLNCIAIKLFNKIAISESFVSLVKKQINRSLGVLKHNYITLNIRKNKKFKIDITAGIFNPLLWEPAKCDSCPT